MKPYYEHAGVTIFHGDCREILPQIEAVDHVITDPPYGRDVYIRALGHNTKKGSRTPDRLYKGDSLAKLAAGEIGHISDMLDEVAAHFGKTRRWVLVFSDVETCFRWRAALEASGLRYVRTGAWVKPDPMPQMTGDRPGTGFEPATICHSSAKGGMKWNGGGRPGVWTYNTCKVNRPNHPCPKPEPLMVELVSLFSNAGETILDPFMGSGTTLVAAKRLGRKAIGIELEEKYCEIAARRLQQEALPLEVA